MVAATTNTRSIINAWPFGQSRNPRSSCPSSGPPPTTLALLLFRLKFHLIDYDILAGLSFPSKRFGDLEQPPGPQPQRLSYSSSPAPVQFRHDAREGFRQLAFA